MSIRQNIAEAAQKLKQEKGLILRGYLWKWRFDKKTSECHTSWQERSIFGTN